MRRLYPALACFLATLAVVCALSWPLPIRLREWHLLTVFGDSHVWVFDHLADRLLAGRWLTPEGLERCDAGWPWEREARFIAWAPALAFVPLRALLGPLGAANALQLLSLPLSALAAWALLRRWSDDGPGWVAAACAAGWALCPTLLTTFATGEISNTQAWILPAGLYAMDRAGAPGARRWLAGVVVVGIAASFTSPYYALGLPLAWGAWALWRALRAEARGVAALRVIAVGAALAASLLPAYAYYQGAHTGSESQLFQPAQYIPERAGGLPVPSPVAAPEQLVWPTPEPEWQRTRHTVYLGAGALGGGAIGLVRNSAGRGIGAGLAGLGIAISLGPWLVLDGEYAELGGRWIPMPAMLLEAAGYPTRSGGLYYRYAALGGLGLAALSASWLVGRRRGAAIAWGLLALQVVSGAWATGPWPHPGERILGLEALREMAAALPADGAPDGAVMELPLQGPDARSLELETFSTASAITDAAMGQRALVRAALHGRPTTALPRTLLRHAPAHVDLRAMLRTESPRRVRRKMSLKGYRYVIYDPTSGHWPPRGVVEATFGPPDRDGELAIWDLGPAEQVTCAGEPRTTRDTPPGGLR